MVEFQFHKGTIRTLGKYTAKIIWTHFNSIKVRLEHMPCRMLYPRKRFQFHKGTIRTEKPNYDWVDINISIP